MLGFVFGVVPEHQGKGLDGGIIHAFHNMAKSLSNQYEVIEINGIGNTNLTIAGSGPSPALIIREGENVTIKNLQFTSTTTMRGALELQVSNSLVENCTFIDGNFKGALI